jgi:hypothetical protein
MSATTHHCIPTRRPVTDAAIAGFRRLQDRLPFHVLAYEARDGGLICEHRRGRSRPVFYRVTPAGWIQPDQPLDWRTLRFTPRRPSVGTGPSGRAGGASLRLRGSPSPSIAPGADPPASSGTRSLGGRAVGACSASVSHRNRSEEIRMSRSRPKSRPRSAAALERWVPSAVAVAAFARTGAGPHGKRGLSRHGADRQAARQALNAWRTHSGRWPSTGSLPRRCSHRPPLAPRPRPGLGPAHPGRCGDASRQRL